MENIVVEKNNNVYRILTVHCETGSSQSLDLSEEAYNKLRLHFIVKSLPTKKEVDVMKINSFNLLKKEVPELDQVIYCSGYMNGVKWLEKKITK